MILPIQTEDEVLQEKAIIFTEELANWSPETISMAFREHAKISRYMPSLADIVDGCHKSSQSLEYKRMRQSASLPMPDRIPRHVAENNLRRIAEIKKKLGYARSMDDQVQKPHRLSRAEIERQKQAILEM